MPVRTRCGYPRNGWSHAMPRRTASRGQLRQSRLGHPRHRKGCRLNAGCGITRVELVLTQLAPLWLVPLQSVLPRRRIRRLRARIVPCTAMIRVGQEGGHRCQSCRGLRRGADKPGPIPSTESCRHSHNSTSPFQPPPRGLLRSLRRRPPLERTQGRCSNRSRWRFRRLAHPALLELQEPASFDRRGNS